MREVQHAVSSSMYQLFYPAGAGAGADAEPILELEFYQT